MKQENVAIGKVNIYGFKKEVEIAKTILEKYLTAELFEKNEPKARREIQTLIDTHNIRATMTWDGNRVWSKKRILKDINKLIRKGTHALSDYLYDFLHLCCGSIAHYDKQGWISYYPDLESVKDFLIRNEYGRSALAHQPRWASDRIEIIKEIYKLLDIKEASCNTR